jgi:hypothetical protein
MRECLPISASHAAVVGFCCNDIPQRTSFKG